MNKADMKELAMVAIALVMGLLVVGIVAAGHTGVKHECRDGLDNDKDGFTDYPADKGCTNRNDNDETNCGDKVCEGGETSTSCPTDCKPADSCSDTDGGNIPTVFGTVSGYFGGAAYTNSDYCVDSGSVFEYYCSGAYKQSQQQSCGTDSSVDFCMNSDVYTNTTDNFCSSGRCKTNTTTTLKQDCLYGCTSGTCNPPPAMPDLIIANITFAEKDPAHNGTVSVTVVVGVKNVGNASATSSITRLNGIYVFDTSTASLLAGESTFVTQTYNCLYNHTLSAIADYYKAVAESNEANNHALTYIDCII